MDFSDQERIFGTLLGSVPNMRAKTNGVVIYKGYVVAEFGDTTWVDPTYSVAKSMLATVAGIARARRADQEPRCAGRRRRSRTAATTRRATPRSPGSITCSRTASGKATCGARRTTSSAPKRSARARRKPRELKKPGTLLRIQRRPHQPLRAVAAAHLQEAGARGVPRRGDGPDRRVEHVAVDSVPQQLRRRRRQEGGVGERRHALGRRRVDQLVGHGALRLPVAARRQVGRQADHPAGLREGGADAGERANSPGNATATCGGSTRPGKDWRGCRPTRSGATAPAATPSPSRPTTTSWSCGAGTRAAQAEFAKRVIAAIKPGTM